MSDVEKAEEYGQARALVLGGLGLVLLFGLIFAIRTDAAGDGQIVFGVPAYWFRAFINVAGALLIATGGGLLKPSRVLALANDEGTREHRRHSIVIGFWVMIAIGLVGYFLSFHPGAPSMRLLARLTIDGGEAAALLSFATLELRAARG